MIHGDDQLVHSIISAHHNSDPRLAQRFAPYSAPPRSRHGGRFSDSTIARLMSASVRLAGARSGALWAALRPPAMIRSRQSPARCTPGCS